MSLQLFAAGLEALVEARTILGVLEALFDDGCELEVIRPEPSGWAIEYVTPEGEDWTTSVTRPDGGPRRLPSSRVAQVARFAGFDALLESEVQS